MGDSDEADQESIVAPKQDVSRDRLLKQVGLASIASIVASVTAEALPEEADAAAPFNLSVSHTASLVLFSPKKPVSGGPLDYTALVVVGSDNQTEPAPPSPESGLTVQMYCRLSPTATTPLYIYGNDENKSSHHGPLKDTGTGKNMYVHVFFYS